MPQEDAGGKPNPAPKQPARMNVFQLVAYKLFNGLEKQSIVGAIVLFIMMLLTVGDVAGRYFFKAPIQGTHEITGLLLVCVSACALAYSQIKKGHIRVDLITERLSLKGRLIVDVVAYLFCVFASSLITIQTLARAREYFFSTRGNLTETLGIPFFPFLLILGLGFLSLTLVSLVDLIRSIVKVIRE
jgi:TRAP-type C4-dicarboxylate transport system permease small subunit